VSLEALANAVHSLNYERANNTPDSHFYRKEVERETKGEDIWEIAGSIVRQ